MKNIFQAHAADLESLREKVYDAARHRSESSAKRAAWEEASRSFFAAYDQLAFPGGLAREFELLSAGDPQAIEMAVQFLEADPWYFRSGYHKADVLRLLRKHALTEDQSARLRDLILKHVRGRPVRETRNYCRFAPKVANPEFEAEILRIARESNRHAVRHAEWVIQCMRSAASVSKRK